MKRMMAALLLIGLAATSAPANGRMFGNHPWFGRQTTTAYYSSPAVRYYYAPAPVYYAAPIYTQAPIYVQPYVQPAPICNPIPQPLIQAPQLAIQVPPPMLPVQPPVGQPQRPPDRARPETAPPSERGPIVPPRRQGVAAEPTRTTSLKPGEGYFSIYAGEEKSNGTSRRSRVTFWNLAEDSFTVRVNGQVFALSAGRSLTVDPGRQFSWQVDDRPEEAGRLSAHDNSLTVVIRR